MSCQNPTHCGSLALPRIAAEDAQVESAVLAYLIEEHPALLTIPELSRTLNAQPGGFEQDDAVERAIRELVGAGLLHCQGGFLLPTRAALYFAQLESCG